MCCTVTDQPSRDASNGFELSLCISARGNVFAANCGTVATTGQTEQATVMRQLSCLALALASIAGTTAGCAESHTTRRILTPDGSRVDAGFTSGRCLEAEIDTIVIGPDPGCASIVVRGMGVVGPSLDSSGAHVRIVRVGERAASVEVIARCDLGAEEVALWTLNADACPFGESSTIRCDDWRLPESVGQYPFDAIARENASEHIVNGAGVVELVACVE